MKEGLEKMTNKQFNQFNHPKTTLFFIITQKNKKVNP